MTACDPLPENWFEERQADILPARKTSCPTARREYPENRAQEKSKGVVAFGFYWNNDGELELYICLDANSLALATIPVLRRLPFLIFEVWPKSNGDIRWLIVDTSFNTI